MVMKNHRFLFLALCFGASTLIFGNVAFADSDNLTLVIKTATSEKLFDGMWVEIKSGENTVYSGFSPISYNVTLGTSYTISISEYGNFVFDHWDDGNSNNFRTIQPTSDVTLVAYYRDKSSSEDYVIPEKLPLTSILVNETKPSILPDWLRVAAKSWFDGQLSDTDFVATLQRLIDEKILISPPTPKEPPKQEGFSNLQCRKGDRYVEMVGKYTNGEISYDIISLKLVLLDSAGNILATGSGTIADLGSYETKYFNAIARYHMDYASCDIQVESVIQKVAANR
jgi:hypothetical protein